MAHREQDQGVEPEGEEIILTEGGLMHRIWGRARRVLDATGRPAAPEDDKAGD